MSDSNKDSRIEILIQRLDSKIEKLDSNLNLKIEKVKMWLMIRLSSIVIACISVAFYLMFWFFDQRFDYTNAQNSDRFSNLENAVYIGKDDILSDQILKALKKLLKSQGIDIFDPETRLSIPNGNKQNVQSNRGKGTKTQSKRRQKKAQKKKEDNNKIVESQQKSLSSEDKEPVISDIKTVISDKEPVISNEESRYKKVSEPSRETQSVPYIKPAGFIFMGTDKEINNETK